MFAMNYITLNVASKASSAAMASVVSCALQDEKFSTFYNLLWRVPLMDVPPPHDGVIVGVWHAHYPF